MATAKNSKVKKYRERILISKEEVEASQVGLHTQKAETQLEQGILSVKGQLIDAQLKVGEKREQLKTGELLMEEAKGAKPFNVQSVLNARAEYLTAQNEVTAAEAEEAQIKETLDFLVELKTELF